VGGQLVGAFEGFEVLNEALPILVVYPHLNDVLGQQESDQQANNDEIDPSGAVSPSRG
jgi:hypothetical protein